MARAGRSFSLPCNRSTSEEGVREAKGRMERKATREVAGRRATDPCKCIHVWKHYSEHMSARQEGRARVCPAAWAGGRGWGRRRLRPALPREAARQAAHSSKGE